VVDAEFDALRTAGIEVALFQTDPEKVRSGRTYPLTAAVRVATGRGPDLGSGIEQFAPDIVHVHNAFPDLGERALARLAHPLVLTLHNYRSFCANAFAFRDAKPCLDCVLQPGGSWNAVVHGCHHGRLGSIPLAIRNHGGPAANPLIRRAAVAFTPSEQARRVLVRAGLDSSKVSVSPHFLPDALVPAGQRRPATRDYYAFVGRLTPEKGLDSLLANWPVDRSLIIVGDGSDRRRLSDEYGSPHVQFAGLLPRHEVVEVLAGARALVFPSLWWETFGLVAMEAICVGTPIVSVGQHAVADLVRDHRVGHSIDDPSAIVQALTAIEALDPGAWGEHVSGVFRQHFTQSAWTQRRLDEYAAILATTAASRT
jgi:glycosyltransferase involved in cell wall biosynthesis